MCVIFSLSTVFNTIINWVVYRNLPAQKTVLGSAVGLIGISLIFWKDIVFFDSVDERLLGIALATMGTFSFSCGNIVSLRHKARELPISTTNAWGMLYGAAIMLLINLAFVGEFKFSFQPNYIVSLLFLAIPGSVMVFAAYLSLINRLGPSRAAYATILFPIIALTISYFYESYRPDMLSILGIALALLGNAIVFTRRTVA